MRALPPIRYGASQEFQEAFEATDPEPQSAADRLRAGIALKRAAWNRMILDEYERPTYPPRLSLTQYPVRCPSCRAIVAACEDLGHLRWSCLACARTWLEAA